VSGCCTLCDNFERVAVGRFFYVSVATVFFLYDEQVESISQGFCAQINRWSTYCICFLLLTYLCMLMLLFIINSAWFRKHRKVHRQLWLSINLTFIILVISMFSNKKLSYCKGTARCTVIVNLCHVSRGMGVRKVSNSKTWPSLSFQALAVVPFSGSHTISYYCSVAWMFISS